MEPLVVFAFQPRPCPFEIGEPCHERPVVIGGEIVPVFHDKQAFRGRADLFDGRKHGIGEYVFHGPRIRSVNRLVTADSVQEEKAAVLERSADYLHIGPIILVADMLDHAERYDVVELLIDVSIILEAYLYW